MKFQAGLKRRLAGKIAKIEGDALESKIDPLARQIDAIAIRIPNASKTIKLKGKLVNIRAKSPFDYLVAKFPGVVYFDCKSINANRFPASLVTPHQVKILLALEQKGFIAGFLINFRKANWVAFIPASILNNLKKGESVGPTDGIDLGRSQDFSLLPLF